MESGGGVVHAGEGDGLAEVFVLGVDGVERGDGGCVPDVGACQVDDDAVGVVGVFELGGEVVAGGEEQFSVDGVAGGRMRRPDQ